MSGEGSQNLRGLPRVFVPGAHTRSRFELPNDEVNKLRKVLRLSSGDTIAVLPNDGTLIICELDGHGAIPKSVHPIHTESPRKITLAQALPKGDKLDEIIRASTEIGVAEFILFPGERSVVRWDRKKLEDRLFRLDIIAREACEVAFRSRIPKIHYFESFPELLRIRPNTWVLSETEGEQRVLPRDMEEATIAVGPEGGWAPREIALIADRAVTLGPRVLRVEHAGPAAAALLLLAQ